MACDNMTYNLGRKVLFEPAGFISALSKFSASRILSLPSTVLPSASTFTPAVQVSTSCCQCLVLHGLHLRHRCLIYHLECSQC